MTAVQQISNFSEANRYLNRFYKNARTKYTLDNMRALMAYLGNPQDTFRIVHVAGTSGKTSTAYYMSALLAASGAQTGLTVSPHVDSLNERLQINGRPLPEAAFCKALETFLEVIEQAPVKPSWFELMVAFAYWYFAREQIDYAVVEVGLGGLHDGTNVVTRADKVCIITDIGLDHTNVLGRNLSEIAAQKAGIVQMHNNVFTYQQPPEVMQVFETRCTAKQADLHIVPAASQLGVNDLPAYQVRNWQLACAVYEHIRQRDGRPHLTRQVLSKTQRTRIPGRSDVRHLDGKLVIMDGAHNVQKMTAFLDSFRQSYPGVKPALLLALKDGKEYEDLVPLLAPTTGRLIITGFNSDQDTPAHSMSPEQLAAAFREAGKSVEVITEPATAYQSLLSSSEPILVITGSFYLLSQIRNNEHLS